MNVLLVHGFLNTGRVFHRLEKRLAAAGHACFAPTLAPRDGRHGLADLSHKLAAHIDAALPPAPFAVIGFSMGCLVARHYLQSTPAHRANAFFAISGPMRGTATAFLYPGRGTRDMRYASRFLRELDAALPALGPLPFYTYYTPLDLMILPAASSRVARAQERRIWSPHHRAMLSNGELVEDVLRKLTRLAGTGAEKSQG